MIKVKIFKKGTDIEKIKITGHAKYADYGKDIVCSGVSSIVITTITAIMSFDEKYISYTSIKDDFTEIRIEQQNEIVKTLISNMIRLLNEIKEDYPKNIEIKEENL